MESFNLKDAFIRESSNPNRTVKYTVKAQQILTCYTVTTSDRPRGARVCHLTDTRNQELGKHLSLILEVTHFLTDSRDLRSVASSRRLLSCLSAKNSALTTVTECRLEEAIRSATHCGSSNLRRGPIRGFKIRKIWVKKWDTEYFFGLGVGRMVIHRYGYIWAKN